MLLSAIIFIAIILSVGFVYRMIITTCKHEWNIIKEIRVGR